MHYALYQGAARRRKGGMGKRESMFDIFDLPGPGVWSEILGVVMVAGGLGRKKQE